MTGVGFRKVKLVRFQHCDPGGVVFTPQYVNLFVEVLEDWFAEGLGYSFADLVSRDRCGIPALRVVLRFFKPSVLGDKLNCVLRVKRLKDATALLQIDASCSGRRRSSVELLCGFVSLDDRRLVPWPVHLREGIAGYLVSALRRRGTVKSPGHIRRKATATP